MSATINVPVWLFILILLFAAVTFASHFLFPSVRWFFRRRLERAVKRLNERLERPIQPFKLARRHDMIQRLIYHPDVTEAIVEHARETGVPENVAFETARRYAREIVPGFSTLLYYGIAIRLARWLSKALYHVRLSGDHADALSDVDPDATVVFVMNHRSNMDYVLVTYLVAERSTLAYAVGEWARVWPLSRLIRAMGAYFIRRRSRNGLYRRVLARYVRLATEGGVAQAMFPEGGLSLDGGLAPPKLGLLKYITDGFDPEGRDVVFVPVALNYDRVLEDRILIDADERGQRRFRARISVVTGFMLKQLWLWLRGRYRRFGAAAVGYGEPLSLAGFDAPAGTDPTKVLAEELMRRIGDAVPVLPVPLVASCLVHRGPMSEAALRAEAQHRLSRMPRGHDHLVHGSVEQAVRRAVNILGTRSIVTRQDGVVAIAPGQEGAVRYYARSIAHLEADHSAAAK